MVDKLLAFYNAHIWEISDAMLMVAAGLLVFCVIWLLVHAITFD